MFLCPASDGVRFLRYFSGDIAVKVYEYSARNVLLGVKLDTELRIGNAAGAVKNDDVTVSADFLIQHESMQLTRLN